MLRENILQEFDTRRGCIIQENAHRIDVNAPDGARQTGNACRQSCHGRPSQMLLLAMVDRLKWASISSPPPRLDFNHMDVTILLGDDIQLSVAGTEVPGHDTEAVVGQPSSRKFLTCVSQRPVVLPVQTATPQSVQVV